MCNNSKTRQHRGFVRLVERPWCKQPAGGREGSGSFERFEVIFQLTACGELTRGEGDQEKASCWLNFEMKLSNPPFCLLGTSYRHLRFCVRIHQKKHPPSFLAVSGFRLALNNDVEARLEQKRVHKYKSPESRSWTIEACLEIIIFKFREWLPRVALKLNCHQFVMNECDG